MREVVNGSVLLLYFIGWNDFGMALLDILFDRVLILFEKFLVSPKPPIEHLEPMTNLPLVVG